MRSYLQDAIKEFREKLITISAPTRGNLFTLNHQLPLVDKKERNLF